VKYKYMLWACALAAAMAPTSTHNTPPVHTPRFAAHHPMDGFLARISHLESSGGKNTQHKSIDYGLHSGTTAIGEYGLMPLTARDIARKSKNAFLFTLRNRGAADIANLLSEDKEMAKEVARECAQRLYRRFRGDEARMAWAWRMGPNREPEYTHPYVVAFLRTK
jgi:hypothetical protein